MLRGTSSSTLNIRTTSEAKLASTEDLEIGVDVTETSSQRYLATLSNQLKGTVLCLVGILTLSPDTLLLRSLALGFTMLAVIVAISKEKSLKVFKDIGLFGWVAGLIWGASNMLFTAAVQNTAAANALVIVASNTAFSSLFSYILLGELTPFRMWVTTFICFGAIALIFSGGAGGGSGDFLGSILAVISAITQGLFFSLIRYKYTKGIDVSNTDILCYNVIASFSVCVVSLALNPDLSDVHGVEVVYILVDGIIVLAGGFGLLVIGPSYLPANEVSLFFLIETFVGPVLVYLGGYEAPPRSTLYAGICLIVALAVNSVLGIREERLQKIADAVILQEDDKKSESVDIFEATCDSVIFDSPKEDDIVIEVRPSSIKIEGNNTI